MLELWYQNEWEDQMDKNANPVIDKKIQPFNFGITEVALTQYQEF